MDTEPWVVVAEALVRGQGRLIEHQQLLMARQNDLDVRVRLLTGLVVGGLCSAVVLLIVGWVWG